MRTILVLLGTIFVLGCGEQNPNLTPQANVARYAGDVVASMRIVQQTIAAAPLPEATIAAAMNRFIQAEQLSNKLAAALQAYDTAATIMTKESAAISVDAILFNLNTILFDIGAPLVGATISPNTRTQIERLINNVQGIIAQIRLMMPQLRPPPLPVPPPSPASPGAFFGERMLIYG
jgi:hypothetical protein